MWWGLGVLTCLGVPGLEDLHKMGGCLGGGRVGFIVLVGATWGELCIECSMHICQVFGVCNNKVS